MPSRKGWVTGLPEELWVCAAAEVTRRRPAAPPERARYMASQASGRRTAPQAWHVCSGAACQARGGAWQARVGVDGAGRTVYSKNLKETTSEIPNQLMVSPSLGACAAV